MMYYDPILICSKKEKKNQGTSMKRNSISKLKEKYKNTCKTYTKDMQVFKIYTSRI